MILETTQTVPLEVWQDGSIRVKGTRLLVEMIINAHKRGECPEEIFDSFPSAHYTIADIYAIIAFYLAHKDEIENYLAKQAKEAEIFWQKLEADPQYQVRIRKFKQFRNDKSKK